MPPPKSTSAESIEIEPAEQHSALDDASLGPLRYRPRLPYLNRSVCRSGRSALSSAPPRTSTTPPPGLSPRTATTSSTKQGGARGVLRAAPFVLYVHASWELDDDDFRPICSFSPRLAPAAEMLGFHVLSASPVVLQLKASSKSYLH